MVFYSKNVSTYNQPGLFSNIEIFQNTYNIMRTSKKSFGAKIKVDWLFMSLNYLSLSRISITSRMANYFLPASLIWIYVEFDKIQYTTYISYFHVSFLRPTSSTTYPSSGGEHTVIFVVLILIKSTNRIFVEVKKNYRNRKRTFLLDLISFDDRQLSMIRLHQYSLRQKYDIFLLRNYVFFVRKFYYTEFKEGKVKSKYIVDILL